MSDPAAPTVIHASAVAHAGRGCLILGPAGSGKTTLALELMALGARLVADDRVEIRTTPEGPMMAPSARLEGLVEIRGAGILRAAAAAAPAPLWLAADLGRASAERMPQAMTVTLAGRAIPVIACRGRPATAAALMAILTAGSLPDPEFMPGGSPA